jgi:predicted nuclease of predicted toxin-antitoxin system
MANAQQSVLLTGDKDFGELLFRMRRVSAGIILIRLSGLTATLKANIVSKAVQEHGNEMVGSFTVIESNIVRIRKNADGS